VNIATGRRLYRSARMRGATLDRSYLDLDQPFAPVVIGTFRPARERKMISTSVRSVLPFHGFVILVVLLMVWLYGVVHH